MGETRTIAICAAMIAGIGLAGAKTVAAGHPSEAELIKIIQSDAPPQDKAIPCKQLAIWGTPKAVPALAALLPDKDLSSWARIALEAIPGDEACEALRAAACKLSGRLQIGVINSLGVREYAKATGDLKTLLANSDADVAAAAAAALGRIGSPEAAKALEPALVSASPAMRSEAAEGLVRCAEKLVAAGKADDAIRLCEAVRKANVSRQRKIEATRRLVLAKADAGAPMLAELLKSKDWHRFSLGLRLARELPGKAATKVVVAELAAAPDDRKPMLLLALSDRKAPESTTAAIDAASSGAGPIRVAAIGILQKTGDVSCVPVLLAAAVSDDADVAKAARLALARLPGEAVNADIAARLQKADGKELAVLADLVGQRQIADALPTMVKLAGGKDADARAVALVAIAAMGTEHQIPAMVALVKTAQDDARRAQAEKALTALCSRVGPKCMTALAPLAQSDNPVLKIVTLHALIAAGGEKALRAVAEAVTDAKDTNVQDEAVRTLATWPNKWPEDEAVGEMLLKLGRSAGKESHRVLAMRGYFQFLQSCKKLSQADRLAKANDAMKLVTRPDEKKQAVAVIASVNSNAALKLLAELTSEPGVAQEACVGIVNLVGSRGGRRLAKAERKRALEAAITNTKSDGVKKKARSLLKGL